MTKDTRLTLRVASQLKTELEDIAEKEGQSAARICEAFLMAGIKEYRRRGAKFLQPFIGRTATMTEL